MVVWFLAVFVSTAVLQNQQLGIVAFIGVPIAFFFLVGVWGYYVRWRRPS